MFQVMIVDDERSVLEGLAYTMPWDSIEVDQVYQAASAYEALDILNRNHVDIVITDIRMPGMSGLELIQEIGKRWSGVRSIILSGHGEFDYAREAIRMQTTDYLLKPITADELMQAVRNVQSALRAEWEQISIYRETVNALREHMPLLRDKVLGDLLQGRVPEWERLQQKLDLLKLSFTGGDPVALLLVRLEDEFYNYGADGLHLLEYAVGNITEEIFGKHFETWCHMDSHSYMVFAIRIKDAGTASLPDSKNEDGMLHLVERLAVQLQQSVLTYLKGNISIMVSKWGEFPRDIHELYESSVTSFHRRIGKTGGLFYSMGDDPVKSDANTLDELYRLPTLLNLLETGGWEEAAAKVAAICRDLTERFPDSREHLLEAYYSLSSTLSHYAHKNGRRFSDLTAGHVAPLAVDDFRSIAQLKDWSLKVLKVLHENVEASMKDSRKDVLKKIQAYVEEHLESDVSLQAIADHIHFHPVYLSKMYKQEMGETLSDYIQRVRMERAVYYLKETDCKIYEIAQRVGYENTYFNKVFKKQFAMTPQEFRGG